MESNQNGEWKQKSVDFRNKNVEYKIAFSYKFK